MTAPLQAPKASPTAVPTPSTMSLGRTSGQRSAEIVAGLRAETMRYSPVASALVTLPGRVVARLVLAFGGRSNGNINFIAVRTQGFTELAKQFLATRPGPHVVVEVAAGFTPRGYELAKAMPDATVIEVDLPDVVAEKQRRLARVPGPPPPNIRWHAADLGVVQLADALGGQQADVITAEGLLSYFPLDQAEAIVRHAAAVLKPGGLFMADMLLVSGEQAAGRGAEQFKRHAGATPGRVERPDQAEALFAAAGLVRSRAYTMTEVQALFPQVLPAPVADIEVMALGYAPDADRGDGS